MENGPRPKDYIGGVGMRDMLRDGETLAQLPRGYVILHPDRWPDVLNVPFWTPKRKLYFRLQAWRARNRADRSSAQT